MTEKVLIIDEKSIDQQHSSAELMRSLNKDQRELVKFYVSSSDLWNLNKNEDSIEKFNLEFSKFYFIFLHQSHDNPILNDPRILLDYLPQQVQLVLFSGARNEGLDSENNAELYTFPQNKDLPHYEIRREIYFENFPKFLDSYLVSGGFRIEALYDRNFSVKKEKAKELFSQIESKLEESEVFAAESAEFKEFFNLAGYWESEVKGIVENYKTFDHNRFLETLENELSKL